MAELLRTTVNGTYMEVMVDPKQRLADFLRNDLMLTGTKIGCRKGECGACTVIMDGRAVTSCLVSVMRAMDADIWTIEGLGNGMDLHPLQKAFIEKGAVQCGFCTPGMIMSAKALLDGNPSPSKEEIREALSGNICRCTGYVKIEEAVSSAAADFRKGGHV